MHKIIFILLFLGASTLQGQVKGLDSITIGKELRLAQTFPAIGCIDFSVDNLGNLYLLNAAGLLKKLSNTGDSLNVFNDVRRYGNVFSIDVTNPLKILLYFRDFSTVVMLDRFLNRINTIDLRKANIFQAKAVGLSYDNNIWVYDEQTARLKKVAEDGRVLLETTDLRLALSYPPTPDRLIDRDGFVYLYDAANGLYVFDYYGALKNELPFKDLKDINIAGATLAGRRENRLLLHKLRSFNLAEANLPPVIGESSKIAIMPQGIYVLNNQQILLFSYQ